MASFFCMSGWNAVHTGGPERERGAKFNTSAVSLTYGGIEGGAAESPSSSEWIKHGINALNH